MENLVYPDLFNVEIRPIVCVKGRDMISTIRDAECYGVYYKTPGRPACREAVFDEADDALWHLLYDAKYRDHRKWYNGREARIVIEEEDDVFMALADTAASKTELDALARKLGIDPAISYVLVRRVLKRRATHQ